MIIIVRISTNNIYYVMPKDWIRKQNWVYIRANCHVAANVLKDILWPASS